MRDPNDLILDLPKRDYWLIRELVPLFGVSSRAIQKCCKLHNLGVKVRHGSYGIILIRPEDLQGLCENIHGVVGRPKKRIENGQAISS